MDVADRSTVVTPISIAAETAAAVEDTAALLDVTDRSTAVTPIPVAAETAAAVEDTAALLDVTDRSTTVTPIPVAAETAAAVEDTAALLDLTDRSTTVTPIPVAAEIAAAVEDTASTLDNDQTPSTPMLSMGMPGINVACDISESNSEVPTLVSVAAKTAAPVEDTATPLDPVDGSTTINPIHIDNKTPVAVEDTPVTFGMNDVSSEGPTPPPITATVLEDITTLLEPTDESIAFIPNTDETAAAVEDTTVTPDVDEIPSQGSTSTPIATEIVTTTQNIALLEPADEPATVTLTPVAAEIPVGVEESVVIPDMDGNRPKAAPAISGTNEAVVEYVEGLSIPDESKADVESLEVQGSLHESSQPVTSDPDAKVESVPDVTETVPVIPGVTPTNIEIEVSSSLEAVRTDLCQPFTEIEVPPSPVITQEDVIASSGKVAPVSQDIIQGQPGAGDQLRDTLFTSGAGLAGAALIGMF